MKLAVLILMGLLALGCSHTQSAGHAHPSRLITPQTQATQTPQHQASSGQLKALDHQIKQIKQWLKDFMQTSEQGQYKLFPSPETSNNPNDFVRYGASCPDGMPHCKKITTELLSAYGEFYKNNTLRATGVCLGIVSPDGQLGWGFCLKNFTELTFLKYRPNKDKIRLMRLEILRFIPSTLTSAQYKPVRLTFRIAPGNRFYLYGFREFDSLARETYHDFYDQPRDDPHNDRKYPLTMVNNWLLEHLKNQQRVFKFRGEALQNSIEYISMQNDLYALVRSSPQLDSKLTGLNCLTIINNGRIVGHSLCLVGFNQAGFSHKGDFLTFEFTGPLSNTLAQKLYVTFRLIDGEFWLHQFSEQNFKVSPDGKQELMATQIVYRQSRDDPKREHPINFGSLDSDFQENLLARCKERGYCM